MTLSVTHVTPLGSRRPPRDWAATRQTSETHIGEHRPHRAGCGWSTDSLPGSSPSGSTACESFGRWSSVSLAAAGGEEAPLAVAWLPEPGVVTHQVAPYSVAPSSLGASERPPSPPPLTKACRWSILRRAWRLSPDGPLECIQHLLQGRTPLNAADSSKRSALVGDAPASRLPNLRETAEPGRARLRNSPAQHRTSSVWGLA